MISRKMISEIILSMTQIKKEQCSILLWSMTWIARNSKILLRYRSSVILFVLVTFFTI